MATTSPDNIYSPDLSNPWLQTVDLAAMADSVQAGLVSVREGVAYRTGTNAERLAMPPGGLFDGLRFYAQDTDLEWLYANSAWRVAGGLMPFANANVTAGSIPANTWTTLALTPVTGRHITVASGKLTVSITGRYRISADAVFAASIFGQVRIWKNGTDLLREGLSGVNSNGATFPEATAEINLVAGDYLDIQAVSNSGGTLFGGAVAMTFVPGA